MSDDIQHIDIDGDEFENAPKALRDYAQKLKKKLAETAKERDGFRNQLNESALGDVLTGFKNPSTVKSALLAAQVDPLDSEAVSAWIEENGGDYARAEANPNPATEQPNPEAGAFEAFQVSSTYRPSGDLTKLDAVAARLPVDATPEQVDAAIRAAGL